MKMLVGRGIWDSWVCLTGESFRHQRQPGQDWTLLRSWACDLLSHTGPHTWLMLCSHHLEILNFWTRRLTVSLCIGHHRLYRGPDLGISLCKLGFPCGSAGRESICNAGDLGSIPGLGRSPGEGKGYPLHYSGLENSINSIVHGVMKSQTWLSNFHFHFMQIIRPCDIEKWKWSHSVMSDSLQPHGL